MSDIAIRVENLSKLYRIGAKQESYRTLRDTLSEAASAPFRRIRSAFQHTSDQAPTTENDFWALKDISFEVKRGEVVGIIGRNGAGKSTLLKILSRITEPTRGHADIHGHVGSLLEVGTGFHQELTGRENIFLNGAILGMKRAEIDRKFDAIVEFAEVEQFIDTAVKHYSSGMYLRLAFAVAAHLDPEILLVDEVLAVGDIAFQRKCLSKMREVSSLGKTVLTVSHNMQVITGLCHRVIWLLEGNVVLEGTADFVVSEYEKSNMVLTSQQGRVLRSPKPRSRAWVDWIDITNDAGKSLTVFSYGDYINLTIKIVGELPPATYFEWVLFTEKGYPATSGGTYFKDRDYPLPTPSGCLKSRIGPIPLAEGRYSLHMRLGIQPGYELLDVWEDAMPIMITNCQPEPNGISFDTRRGVIYIPADYSDADLVEVS